MRLIKDIQRSPFAGIGKPEPLKHPFSGFWSRRFNDQHRLVYTFLEAEWAIVYIRSKYLEKARYELKGKYAYHALTETGKRRLNRMNATAI